MQNSPPRAAVVHVPSHALTPSVQIDFRPASATDSALLAPWNFQLIRDEGHSNRMSIPELEVRMRGWLSSGSLRAVIFLRESVPVGYALFGLEPDSGVYLRQFFICREHRRQGIGTAAMNLLVEKVLPAGARLSLVVLAHNETGRKFWSSLGFEMHAHILERRADGSRKGRDPFHTQPAQNAVRGNGTGDVHAADESRACRVRRRRD